MPQPLPIAAAMSQSTALASLLARLHESRSRYEAVRETIPEPLRAHVRPGPVDERGWSLLAANGAIAAKLRQLLPQLEQALLSRGWEGTPIRVRIQSGVPPPG